MKGLIAGLLFATVLAAEVQALCVPGTVSNISLGANYNLNWAAPPNPQGCQITRYVIDIVDPQTGIQRQFESSNLYYYVGFLDFCKNYYFEVHALTNESVLGPSVVYNAPTPPPQNLNLTVSQLNGITTEEEIDLTWDLAIVELDRCVSYYRVVYWDESEKPTDVYVYSKNFTLKEGVPCMEYRFQVNAILENPDIQGPISEVVVVGRGKVPAVPKIVGVNTTKDSVTMSWKVESYKENRCKLVSLQVYTPGAPANVSSLNIPIVDSVARSNVNVVLEGLQENYIYTSFVRLVNDYGISKNVTITYQTADSFVFDLLLDVSY